MQTQRMWNGARTAAAVGFVVAVALSAASGQAQATRTVWDGVYTTAQAERGAKNINACTVCHGENLRGGAGAPAIAGNDFLFGWNAKTAGELFTYIRQEMPPGQAGAFSEEEYAEILAAMLRASEFPASETAELKPADLAGITILREKP